MADTIDTLLAMDDTALAAKIGQDKALARFKEQLADAAKLPKEQRDEANERIDKLLNPVPDARDIGWIVDDLEREARVNAKRSATSEINDTSPDSMGAIAAPPSS